MAQEFEAGEEGVDYISQTLEERENDPTVPNEKMLLRQIRSQINFLKQSNPEEAARLESIIQKDEFDDLMSREYDLDEVKIYPGSEKGPTPEDDPRAFSKWFMEN